MLFKNIKTGGIYEFAGLSVIEGTLEAAVLYRPLYKESPLWVRPAKEFFEKFEPYLFIGHAPTAEDIESDEPDQTIGEALELAHNRRKQ